MNNEDLLEIQDRIDYNFKNVDLLQQAFVRRSYAKENGGEDNEVLEFIGDKALDIIIVKILVEMFGFYTSQCNDYDVKEDFDEFCCEHSEGKLTALKQNLVGKKMLASRIDRLQLADYLIMGKGDVHNHVDQEDSVKEDLFEAIIGAVTLDSGWNWEEIRSVVECMLQPEELLSKDKEDNYVELIQEWSLKRYQELPRMRTDNLSYYEKSSGMRCSNEVRFWPKQETTRSYTMSVVDTQEYYKTHFKCELILKDIRKVFIGYGKSKREARKVVCQGTYRYLKEQNLLFSIRDEIENPNKADAVSQLEILSRRGYFSIPTYDFELRHDRNGNPIWRCECHIEERDTYFWSESSSKKDAKKTAAFEMLKYVLDEGESW